MFSRDDGKNVKKHICILVGNMINAFIGF